MVRMINCWTNTEMLVADDRVEEYRAAGCVLAATSEKPTVEVKQVEKPKAEPKKTTKKVTTKKK